MFSERIATGTNQQRTVRLRLKTRTTLIGITFIAPAFILMTYTTLIPTFWSYMLSLQTGGFRDLEWNGLQNYSETLTDPVFLKSLWNSAFIAVVSTTFSLLIGVALALMIFQLRRVEGAIYRFVIFMPTMLPLTISGLMFIFVFNQESGILNNLLRILGLGNLTQAWLAKPPLNLYAICLVNIWRTVGLPMMLAYAALQSIPIALLESSKLEGATYLAQVRLILLPLLRPILLTATTFLLIINFKAYDLVLVLTNGGPGNSSRIVPIHIVETAFTFNDFGGGASMGVIMTFAVLAILGIVHLIMRSETYEY